MTSLQIRELALSLPPEERRTLADALWQSLDAGDLLPLSAAQKELIERRRRRHEAHPEETTSWQEMRASLLAKRAAR